MERLGVDCRLLGGCRWPIELFETPMLEGQEQQEQAGQLTPWTGGGGSLWLPRTDVVEQGDGFVMRLDVPGVKKENVSIDIEGEGGRKMLTLSGDTGLQEGGVEGQK